MEEHIEVYVCEREREGERERERKRGGTERHTPKDLINQRERNMHAAVYFRQRMPVTHETQCYMHQRNASLF